MAILQIVGTGAGDLLRSTNGGPTEIFGDVSPTAPGAATAPFGNDTLIGGPGNDTIFGQQGTDSLIGSGNDDLRGGQGQDTLIGTGSDSLFGNKDADQLFGGIDARGGQGNDTIFGSTTGRGELGNDIIYGGTTLLGGNGNDTLVAAAGNQTLTGNESSEDEFTSDQFVFAPATPLTISGQAITQGGFGGIDTITDFQSGPGTGDIVKLVNLDAGATVAISQVGADVNIVIAGTSSPQVGSPVPTSNAGSITTTANQPANQTIVVRNVNLQQFLAVGSDDLEVNGIIVDQTRVQNVNTGTTTFTYTVGERTGVNFNLAGLVGGSAVITATSTNVQLNGVPITTTVNNDTITGTDFDDTIDGNAGNDTIFAESGNDSVQGNAGNDSIAGGLGTVNLVRVAAFTVDAETAAGSDFLFGGDDNDIIWGETAPGNALSPAGVLNDYIEGNAGNDTLLGQNGDDTLVGGAGNDSLLGQSGNDYANGGAGNDIILDNTVGERVTTQLYSDIVGDNNSRIVFNAATATTIRIIDADLNDTGALGRAGAPEFWDPNGDNVYFNDVYIGGEGDDTITSESGDDLITGDAGNDILDGKSGNDLILGGAATDIVLGGAGSDTISGGTGADTLDGGDDFDYLYYAESASGVVVPLPEPGNTSFVTNVAGSTTGDGIDLISNFEGVLGSGFGDVITGNSLNNHIAGLGGDDVIVGGGGIDTLQGNDGDDSITGSGALFGDAGDDSLTATGVAPSALDGGSGEDTLISSTAFGDVLTGGSGDDLYVLNNAADTVVEASATGGTLDVVRIQAGGVYTLAQHFTNIERIEVNTAAPVSIPGNLAGLVVPSNAGVNITFTGNAAVVFDGGSGNDVLVGGGGDNQLNGADGNDNITGLGGNDILVGGAGADTLRGGFGADVLTGGTGGDRFDYRALAESAGVANVDRVTDFNNAEDFFVVSVLPPVVTNAGLLGAATNTIDEVYTAAIAAFPALGANEAVTFSTFGGLLSGQFLIINNGTVGVSTADALIRLDAVTGGINNASFTTAI